MLEEQYLCSSVKSKKHWPFNAPVLCLAWITSCITVISGYPLFVNIFITYVMLLLSNDRIKPNQCIIFTYIPEYVSTFSIIQDEFNILINILHAKQTTFPIACTDTESFSPFHNNTDIYIYIHIVVMEKFPQRCIYNTEPRLQCD